MPRFLVKYRKFIFALMAVCVVVCALMVPHIHINTDMTQYMPDSYPMKQGLDLMESELPALQGQMQEFGSIFADGNDLMPTDLPRILTIGVSMLFLVLLVMCSSFVEVGLFMATTGFAVVLNMGTNALLPSVSMMTNTLTPVLQMVLSMDYCIILMNRYRQEKALGKDKESAMEGAIREAASSILSSAFTTIVSLMMLCFIKLKIGADLGIVLSKGVAFSLLCIFTVLPFLIITADKAVEATRKKIPRLPFGPIARGQHRLRYVLLVLFVGVFAAFAFLQRRTQLSFSPQWESQASALETGENAALLLYANAEDGALPQLMDTIAGLPNVHQALSYPSLVLRPRTAAEMGALFKEFAPGDVAALPEDMLQLVYYARFHPQRTERLSFPEMMALAGQLADKGLIPAGFDPSALFPAPEPEEQPVPEPASEPEAPVILSASEGSPAADSVATPAALFSVVAPSVPVAAPDPILDYTQLTAPRTASEMASFLDLNPSQTATLYRMAGRKGQTMTAAEMIGYVRKNILSNRSYSAFIPKGTKARMEKLGPQIDSVLAAGPRLIAVADSLSAPAAPLPVLPDTVALSANPNTLLTNPNASPVPQDEPHAIPGTPTVIPSEVEESPTPLEELAAMAVSSMRYSSARVHSALSAAGIAVSREQLDLLFLYSGAQKGADPSWKMSPVELLDFVADTLFANPALAAFVPDSSRTLITEARKELLSGVGRLRGERYSAAVVLSGYPAESDSSFVFVEDLRKLADETFSQPHYWIGESEMYKELKDGFPGELLLLTLLTVMSIFLIVAINFRSVFIPIPLVLTILSGVYVNIWASGLGGNTMYYLSYLIIQGILMGATIDYTILFTHYYLEWRRKADIPSALSRAYEGSSHSILTSGLILTVVPYVMSLIMKDAMIASILRSLSIGALSVVALILFVLPGVIAALDPLMKRTRHERQKTA